MLAGGLGPENVGAAIEAVRPWAVDASSRPRDRAGDQGPRRVRAFVEALGRPILRGLVHRPDS